MKILHDIFEEIRGDGVESLKKVEQYHYLWSITTVIGGSRILCLGANGVGIFVWGAKGD